MKQLAPIIITIMAIIIIMMIIIMTIIIMTMGVMITLMELASWIHMALVMDGGDDFMSMILGFLLK